MAQITLLLAAAGTVVPIGGYSGSGENIVAIPEIDRGTGPRFDGTVSFSVGITKTAGGNIDAAVESLRLLRSSDGTNFCELYADNTDAEPVNFLEGQTGTTFKKSLDIRARPGQRFKLVLEGDGVTDTYTIDFAQIDV